MGTALRPVTVVIPVWGTYVEQLPRAVSSVHAQSTPATVIVVDNAHEQLISRLDGCEIARTDVRLSRGAARNLGLSLVATEYVVFLDADDLLLPGGLGALVAGLDRHPGAPALVGRIREPSGRLYRVPRRLAVVLAPHRRLFAWINAMWSLLPTQGCTIMRTAVVSECGGYCDASSGEDWVLGASLAFRGPIAFDPRPVMAYHSRSDSPGAKGAPRRILLQNAARVRRRLSEDPAVRGGDWAIRLLALVHLLAVFIVGPPARALRAARQAPAWSSTREAINSSTVSSSTGIRSSAARLRRIATRVASPGG